MTTSILQVWLARFSILRISPEYKADMSTKMFVFQDKAVRNRFVESLREAGVP